MTETPKTGAGGRLKSLLRSRLLRAAVSAGLLALLVSTLNLKELGDTLARVIPGLLALGILAFLAANLANVLKWRLILTAQGAKAPFLHLTSLLYIGLFFNNLLPSNFGGDVVRAFKLSRIIGDSAVAAGSVVADRASSTFALLFIAAVPAVVELRLLGTRLAALILAMFVLSVVAIAVLASERAVKRLGTLPLLKLGFFGFREHLVSFYYSLYGMKSRKGLLTAVLAASLVYQGLQVLTVYVLALSLGIEVPVVYYFLFIPVVLAVSMVPISLNGLGIREATWVLLFSQVGVPAAEALSMSILSFLVMTVVSLAGGVFYFFDRSLPAAGEGAGNG